MKKTMFTALLGATLRAGAAQAQNAGGVEGLGGLLGQLGGGGLLDAVLGSQATPVQAGNDVLGQIFGSKDVSRTVADHAAGQTGLDSGLLKQMLPILAMMVAGYMAKQGGQQSGGGGLGDLIGGALGGGGSGGGLGGMLVRWAKHLGATVIGTTGSEGKAHVARMHGADHVIVGRDADIVSEVATTAAPKPSAD